MKKSDRKKKWKILLIFIWILFLVAVSIGCISLQRSNVYEKSKKELLDQAEIISRQFADLVDTNFNIRTGLSERQLSEIKSISFVLENYDDINEANDFLEDIVNTTEVRNLWIFDRNGEVVFGSGEAPETAPEPDEIAFILDSKVYATVESEYDEEERYQATTYYFDDDNSNSILWGVKDRWLIYAEDIFGDELKELVQFFDWEHTLQDFSIGRDGTVLAVSEIDGSVLSYPDPSVNGQPVENLDIKIAGNKEAAAIAELKEAFANTGEIEEIEVDSVRYYATRMDIANDLFLVMFPVQSVENEVYNESAFLLIPLAVITGLGLIYVFCLAASDPTQPDNEKRKKRGSAVPIGKLKVFTLLAVTLILFISAYLETHFAYARMFQYTSTTAEDVMQKKNESDKMLKEVQKWLRNGNLEKCRIARCCIQDAPAEKLNRQYVTDLADRLGVSALYVFDRKGKVSLTSAPYDGYTIDEKNPFHALLEGRESVVLQDNQEETPGELTQGSGVTVIDENNRVAGAVVIADRIDTRIEDHLSYDVVFERVSLKDNTVVMAVNDENKTIRYFAQVDGSFLQSDQFSFDYTEVDAASLGMNEDLIRNNFNGEMFAIDNRFFASVRRNENDFLMVLQPLIFLNSGSILSVILMTASSLVLFILMICVTRRFNKACEEDPEDADDQTEEKKTPEKLRQETDEEKDDDNMFLQLSKLANNEKYGFEERWPSDGKSWKQKNPMEKFSAVVKLVCIGIIALIILNVVIGRENSVFYYSFSGEWNSGVNLYSITSCIIYIILLVILKQIIHKVLYLIARAAQSKGETICHLLNSFTGYVLFIAGIFIILANLGVDITAISMTAGVAGIIFGIGCQNIVADILAGIIMAFEGVACVGDFVSFNGKFGTIHSIGVRTTKLKRFSQVTLVRNNEFKNFINMPAEETDRVVVKLYIDLKESLSRVEGVIEKEIPAIRERLCERLRDDIRLNYRGVQEIEENGIELSFAVYCQGYNYGRAKRKLNRELLLMCERNKIRLAMPQIVINERVDADTVSDSDVNEHVDADRV